MFHPCPYFGTSFFLGRVSVTPQAHVHLNTAALALPGRVDSFSQCKHPGPTCVCVPDVRLVKGKRSWVCAKGKVCVRDHREQNNLGCDFWFNIGDCTNTEHWAALSCGSFPFWHAKMQEDPGGFLWHFPFLIYGIWKILFLRLSLKLWSWHVHTIKFPWIKAETSGFMSGCWLNPPEKKPKPSGDPRGS